MKKVSPRVWRAGLLAAILAFALALRLRAIDFGLPALLDPDEPIFVLIGLKLLKEHTLNPGWFGHPGTTTIYSLALVEAGVFLFGKLTGRFPDTHAFTYALYHDPGVVFLPGRMVMVASGLLTIFLAYRLARRLFDTRVALLTACLMAIDPVHIRYSQIIRTDMQATIFVLLTLLAAVKIVERGSVRTYAVAGIWLGVACATKWPAGTVAAGILGAGLLRVRIAPSEGSAVLRGMGVFSLSAIASCIAVSPYLVLDFATLVSNLHGESRPIHLGATGHGFWANSWWYVAHPLRDALGSCGIALAAAGIVAGARRQPIVGYVIASTAGMFVISISLQHLVWERWVVPLLPLLTIAAAYAAVRIIDRARQLGPMFSVPAGLALALLMVVPPLSLADGQAKERAVDTRRLATAWASRNVPAGSTVAIEYLAFDVLSAPWRFLYPIGTQGCFDVRAKLQQQVTVSAVGSWRSSRSIVDLGGIGADHAASCRADYLILTNYDRYLAEGQRYPVELDHYRRIAAGGRLVALFRPDPGNIGGPTVRIMRLPPCAAAAGDARDVRCRR